MKSENLRIKIKIKVENRNWGPKRVHFWATVLLYIGNQIYERSTKLMEYDIIFNDGIIL